MHFIIPLLAVISSLSGLRRALTEEFVEGAGFGFTTTVFVTHNIRTARAREFVVSDGSAWLRLSCTNRTEARAGDVVFANGHVGTESHGHRMAWIDSIHPVGQQDIPEFPSCASDILHDDTWLHRPARISCELLDVIEDDVDPRNIFLMLRDGKGLFFADLNSRDYAFCKSQIGASVILSGYPILPSGTRKYLGRIFSIGGRENLRILAPPAPASPVTALKDANIGFSAADIMKLGRISAVGHVVATWQGAGMLLRTDTRQLVRASLGPDVDLPEIGTQVRVTGLPETDLFNINLSRAAYVLLSDERVPSDNPIDVRAKDILSGPLGRKMFQPQYHGRVIRIRGKTLGITASFGGGKSLNLSCEQQSVCVSPGPCPVEVLDLPNGSEVEITGVCIMNADVCRPLAPLPRIHGFSVIIRTPDDIRVVERPSWWTSGRLMAVIGGLLALLFAIILWNRFLQRIIRRRSGELARMEIAKAMSDLRINERTRLAVDIHDSLSQTLTGVSFHIDAAEKTVGTDDSAARSFLAVARRTLMSCREEMRRCLWDLRNNAIGEPDLKRAVELVLKPHAQSASISVRFNVPRTALTDSTAHAILSIVRELTVNAIRHGKATHVRIAGEQHEGCIRFSVTDDGSGFDPMQCPGVSEGHFGLQGIRERINRLEGQLEIISSPGKGTKIIVRIGK